MNYYYIELTEVVGEVQCSAAFLMRAEYGLAEAKLFATLTGWRAGAVSEDDTSDGWFVAGDVVYRVSRQCVITAEEYATMLPYVGDHTQ